MCAAVDNQELALVVQLSTRKAPEIKARRFLGLRARCTKEKREARSHTSHTFHVLFASHIAAELEGKQTVYVLPVELNGNRLATASGSSAVVLITCCNKQYGNKRYVV